jgi:hypothetical protein
MGFKPATFALARLRFVQPWVRLRLSHKGRKDINLHILWFSYIINIGNEVTL